MGKISGEYTSIRDWFDFASDEYVESFVERFESNYDKGEPDECWEFEMLHPSRYGRISFQYNGESTILTAHRVAKFLANGREDITDKQCNHSCHNKACVNPDHVYLGDQSDNLQDDLNQSNKCRSETMCGLSDDDVWAIRKTYRDTDVTQATLAEAYGVSTDTIFRHVRGKRRVSAGGPIKGDDY